MEINRIKPQDILLLMKILVSPPLIQQKDLSDALLISRAEISYAMKRLLQAGLVTSEGPSNENALEFLVHAVKYLCPPEFGPHSLGVRTSFSHPDFDFVQYRPEEIQVWPHASATDRGVSILPIYKTLPEACTRDPKLYKVAALCEMLRSGRAREKSIAALELKKYLKEQTK